MKKSGETTIRVDCPCCGSTLTIDAGEGTVREWKEAQDPRKAADLKDAEKLLREEKARVEARYQEIVKADKEKGASMERSSRSSWRKARGSPPPSRCATSISIDEIEQVEHVRDRERSFPPAHDLPLHRDDDCPARQPGSGRRHACTVPPPFSR